jgi:Tfp pilus assembly protein PilF
MKPNYPAIALLLVSLGSLIFPVAVYPQTLGHTLYGTLKVTGEPAGSGQPVNFVITLYTGLGNPISRDNVTANGRYRFMNVNNGEYDIVVERDGVQVLKTHLLLQEQRFTDIRHDLTVELRPEAPAQTVQAVPGTVYARPEANSRLFKESLEAQQAKQYDKAATLLEKIVAADPKDYEALAELGTAQFQTGKHGDAEKSYARALEQKPDYIVALVNLGKLRYAQKNFDGAIEVLTKAVEIEPRSADAQYFLGDSYLQTKKGSKAVVCLNEAIRLDPVGKADAHLRLAALYNAARMKDRAAAEYEQFLAKKPDYPERKTLEQYIKENKKP